jgi:hypothetical protein
MGGAPFMLPIDVTAIVNLCLVGFILFNFFSRKIISEKPLEALKHVGGLGLALGAFGTLTGLFQAFGAIEEAKDVIPFNIICGGMKVALINVLYGLIVYIVSLLFYIIFSLLKSPKE